MLFSIFVVFFLKASIQSKFMQSGKEKKLPSRRAQNSNGFISVAGKRKIYKKGTVEEVILKSV